MPPKSTSGRLTFSSSVRVGVYTGISVTSCPRVINSAASPLSRKQLPQYIPAAPAVMDRIFMILRFRVPGSELRVRVRGAGSPLAVRGSTFPVRERAGNKPAHWNEEPRTGNHEPRTRTGTRTWNPEPGTRNCVLPIQPRSEMHVRGREIPRCCLRAAGAS